MSTVSRFVCVCAVGLLLTGGCAPAYHDYSGCYIDCHYCPLPPLPYEQYKDCVCHSCAASRHLAIQPPTAGVDENSPESYESGD